MGNELEKKGSTFFYSGGGGTSILKVTGKFKLRVCFLRSSLLAQGI